MHKYPNVMLETQPMMNGLMNYAMFEGSMTPANIRQYHFSSGFLCFFIFLFFFRLESLKRNKICLWYNKEETGVAGKKNSSKMCVLNARKPM